MKCALLNLGDGPNYRRFEFMQGLKAAGYAIAEQIPRPGPDDLLVTWNRHGWRNTEAQRFEQAGAKVLVVENGWFGKQWQGAKWFALALEHHSGAGRWPDLEPDRWVSWGVELMPFRHGGREVVVLAQRGIGEPGIASPFQWAEGVASRIPGARIRQHPGKDAPEVPLTADLADAWCVVTWHSAAALQALALGIPVYYDFPQWIGRGAAKPLRALLTGEAPLKDEAARRRMFERMAWAMWTLEEVASGEAIKAVCASS